MRKFKKFKTWKKIKTRNFHNIKTQNLKKDAEREFDL